MDSGDDRIRVWPSASQHEMISSKTWLARFNPQIPSVSRWTVTGDIALIELKNPVNLTSFGKFLSTL